MFQISDVLMDKAEVAMALTLTISSSGESEDSTAVSGNICVSKELPSVSKTHMRMIVQKIVLFLSGQGIACFGCGKVKYMLYPLPDDCLSIGEENAGAGYVLWGQPHLPF